MPPAAKDAGLVLIGAGLGLLVSDVALSVVFMLLGAAVFVAFGLGPVREWLGLPQRTPEARDEIGAALAEQTRRASAFLQARAYASDLPEEARLGDEWWRHYHGDAAYEAETVRLFEVEYRPGIAKLLTAADQRGYQPAGPDLAYLADVAGTEDIWVLLLRCRLSARGLTGDPVGVVERLGELQGLGEGLRDALPLGRPPAGTGRLALDGAGWIVGRCVRVPRRRSAVNDNFSPTPFPVPRPP